MSISHLSLFGENKKKKLKNLNKKKFTFVKINTRELQLSGFTSDDY